MPKPAKARHDMTGVPIRLAGDLALSLDAMFEIVAPETKLLWADWDAIAATCQLTKQERRYFYDHLRDGKRLRFSKRQKEALRKNITAKLQRQRRHLRRFFAYLNPIESVVFTHLSASAVKSFPKHTNLNRGNRRIMSVTTETQLNPAELKVIREMVASKQAIEKERAALLAQLNAPQDHHEIERPFVNSRIRKKLIDMAPASIQEFVNRWTHDEIARLRKPDTTVTVYEPIEGKNSGESRFQVISNRRSIQRRIARLAEIIRSTYEDWSPLVTCITEADAEKEIAR